MLLPCVHAQTCNSNGMTMDLLLVMIVLVFVLVFSYEPLKPRHQQLHHNHLRRSSSSCRLTWLSGVGSVGGGTNNRHRRRRRQQRWWYTIVALPDI